MGALDWSDVLKWGPAAPMRTKRAMSCGTKAHLLEEKMVLAMIGALNVGVWDGGMYVYTFRIREGRPCRKGLLHR